MKSRAGFLFAFVVVGTVRAQPQPTERTFMVKSSPTYRESGQQAVDPRRPADPSLAAYFRANADYRNPNAPAPAPAAPAASIPPPPPPPPPPQEPKVTNEYRQPNGTDGVVQNITVLLPPGHQRPSSTFFDHLAQGKNGVFAPAPVYAPPRAGFAYDPAAQLATAYPQNVVNPGFVGPIAPQQPCQPVYGVPEPIPLVVDVEWLDRALMNRRPIRLLDATPSQQKFSMDYRQFRDEYYGKWDRLFNERANVEFQRVHIPTAIHFSTDIGTFPAWNDPSALYPADLFEQYVRRLGINQNDHIVVYSRGTLGGMLSAARVWNLFRIYGHRRVSILDGGFEAWRNANLTLTDVGAPIEPGNWTACFDTSLVIAYEDLIMPDANGYCVFNRLCYYNFLDARPKPDFYGLPTLRDQQAAFANRPNGFSGQQSGQQNGGFNGQQFQNDERPPLPPPPPPPAPQRRTHLPGAKSLPAEDLVRPDGFLLSPPELKLKLQQAGYTPGRESVAAGETPEEASMVILALAMVQDPKVRLYNAGILEIRLRSPNLINA